MAALPERKAQAVELALASFAHEVRTPLTGILAIADLLDTSGLEPRPARWVKTLKASAEHLSALTTLIVDSARMRQAGAKAARAAMRADDFDLGVLAAQVGASLAARAEARGLEARVAIAKSVSGVFRGDAVRLRAALENLIDNAVKFTERGRVAMKVSIGAGTRGRRRISFAIKDSGIGLSAGDIRGLFFPFAQASGGVAARFGGAGLGLFAVRDMARLMGGDVRVISQPGKGATFLLDVQLARVPRDRALSARARAQQATRALDILCVEDNPYGRVVLNTILTELGHRVSFAGDGPAALQALSTQTFDAVFIDLVLPGMSGLDLAKRIRKQKAPTRAVPIFGLSGRDGQARRALAVGMNAFLLKPASVRMIADLLGMIGSSPKV